MSSPTDLTVMVPEAEAATLTQALQARAMAFETATTLRQTGEAAYVTVLLPCVLTAVQVVAAFLIARRRPAPPPKASRPDEHPIPPIRIKLGSLVIGETAFSVEAVEKTLSRKLSDD